MAHLLNDKDLVVFEGHKRLIAIGDPKKAAPFLEEAAKKGVKLLFDPRKPTDDDRPKKDEKKP